MFGLPATVSPEQGIASSSSQNGDEDGCSFSLCCKFEIYLRLFAIWLVVVKLSCQSNMIDTLFYAWTAVPPEQRIVSSSPHCMVMKVDVHSACAASLKLI